jgi:hypothetical protein
MASKHGWRTHDGHPEWFHDDWHCLCGAMGNGLWSGYAWHLESVIAAAPTPPDSLNVERLREDWQIVRKGLPTKAVGPNTAAMLAAATRLDAALQPRETE